MSVIDSKAELRRRFTSVDGAILAFTWSATATVLSSFPPPVRPRNLSLLKARNIGLAPLE